VALLHTPHDDTCPSPISLRGNSYLGRKFGKILISSVKRLASLYLRPNCDLQQFGRREISTFQLGIQSIGKVDLKSWHTPNSTPIPANKPTDQTKSSEGDRTRHPKRTGHSELLAGGFGVVAAAGEGAAFDVADA
jgi:hypothetical protein